VRHLLALFEKWPSEQHTPFDSAVPTRNLVTRFPLTYSVTIEVGQSW